MPCRVGAKRRKLASVKGDNAVVTGVAAASRFASVDVPLRGEVIEDAEGIVSGDTRGKRAA